MEDYLAEIPDNTLGLTSACLECGAFSTLVSTSLCISGRIIITIEKQFQPNFLR